MKFQNMLMVAVVTIVFVLAACSGRTKHEAIESTLGTEQIDTLSIETDINNISESESEADKSINNPVETETEFIDARTPFTSFEQDYGPNQISIRDYSDLEIITLLPKDQIRAIDAAEYYAVAQANREYSPDELVIGVEFNGDARAYAVNLLSRHEIVNDVVGGIKIAVTW